MKIEKCQTCGGEATLHEAPAEFQRENPLADHFTLECTPGCSAGNWKARRADTLIEEWNETQKVLANGRE